MATATTATGHQTGLGAAVASGALGAVVVTAVHQAARGVVPRAPRMDRVGMRAVARGMHALGAAPPTGRRLYNLTLAGDLVANTAYYALAALGGRHSVTAGTALGVIAGLGALALPRRMGLGDPPASDTRANQAMTIAWYTIGGVAAGAMMQRLGTRRVARRRTKRRVVRVATPSPEWRRAEVP
jgi:hypothetical protein